MSNEILNASLLHRIISTETQKTRLWVGYSGGLDSHVLLHLCYQMGIEYPEYEIGAIHIHHGLSPNADAWAQHCEQTCSALQIPLTVHWVDASVKEGESPEEVARDARHLAWQNFLQPNECILLAHHAEDQAETILLRLFRGTGPLGLGGMPNKGMIGNGEFLRPLLMFHKEALIDYAKTHHLSWIEDESNSNLRFDRNFVRHEILPRLSARWPRVVRSVSRAGSLCLETATATQILAAKDYDTVKILDKYEKNEKHEKHEKNEKHDKQYKHSLNPTQLSVSALLKLDPVRRKGVLRYWLQQCSFAFPSRDHMERIDREILQAKPGSKPRLKIGEYEIVRMKDKGNDNNDKSLQEVLCVAEIGSMAEIGVISNLES